MILVDDAGGAYARIDHSPWNGCTLADFVMPFFLFIVGVAIALALKVLLSHVSVLFYLFFLSFWFLVWSILLQLDCIINIKKFVLHIGVSKEKVAPEGLKWSNF